METHSLQHSLIAKYNRPVPRYTSYPPVPAWSGHIDKNQWASDFQRSFDAQNHRDGISLYVHLPFCESLCTYCGCNKKITTNHGVEEEYIAAVEKEWLLYRKLMKQTPVIREIHLGGGTPTFFSPANLARLINFLLKGCIVHPVSEFSIEGHPNNTTAEHLRRLASLGFRRISYGVQDNDPEVQRIINRIQPLENVKLATDLARENRFESINYDLIYGLPLQTPESISRTIEEVTALGPDRIALYSYAHVPWTSRSQRLFDESHLPAADEKLKLYISSRELLLKKGYVDIGMDHFALPTDPLFTAWKNGKLHRNFMGYTTLRTGLLLGLGVSAISDTGYHFAQNEKTIHDYYAAIHSGQLAVNKGYRLSATDSAVKKYILDISCKGRTTLQKADLEMLSEYSFPQLKELQEDGLIDWSGNDITVTDTGRLLLRNICSAFDQYLQTGKTEASRFSKAV
jgi:oxygen-independent coproporphyrinogen-3 oxidase